MVFYCSFILQIPKAMMKKIFYLLAFVSFSGNAQNNFLDFDGVNDVIETPAATATMLANASNITLSCKVFPTRVTAGFPNINGIAGFRNDTDFDFYLIQSSTTDLEARFRNSAGVAFTIIYSGLQLNQWQQFFLVYNGTTLKLYSGNSKVGSVAASGSVPATPSGYLSIGRIISQSLHWNHQGLLDEISLWNKALTPTDISGIVSNSGEIANPASASNLVVYYKMNQGIGYGNNIGLTTVNDELGQHNGIAANFAMTGNASNWGSQNLGISNLDRGIIAVYPNPTSNYISVSGMAQASDVKIFDTAGRLLSASTVAPESAIDVSNLTAGVYFLEINNHKIRFLKK